MHPQFIESSITFVMAAMMAAHTLARSDRSHSTRAVVGLMAALMIWTGSVALARVEPSVTRSYVLSCTAMIGAFLVPPAWAWLALSFTERLRLVGAGRRLAWIFAPSALMVVGLVTNPLHHLIVARPDRLMDHGAAGWAGPFFWPWIAWAYLLVVVGSALYVRASLRLMRGHMQIRSMVMAAAALLPFASSVIHTLGIVPQAYDRTPLLLGLSTIILYGVDWRFRLLDTMPVARRDVIDHLDDGVILADPDGMIVHMNRAAEQMTEVRLVEVAGQPLARVVEVQSEGRMDYDREAFTRVMRDMCASSTGFETLIENYQGRVFEIRGASVSDIEGDVAAIYLILRDRTAATRFEKVLRQSRRSEAVTGLAGGIAHEVNNPLAYVRANVTHLLGQLPKDLDEPSEIEVGEEIRDVLLESLEGIDRISTIVDRLQRLSSPENTAARAFDANRAMADAIGMRSLEGSDHIVLSVGLCDAPCPVYGDRDALLQALVEVLDNAERAVGEAGGHIEVRSSIDDETVLLVIGDDGPGVPRDQRERVFDPFFTTRTDEPGSGLGLAMASKAVGDLDGHIEIADSALGGAQVVLRLPISRT